MLREVRQFRFAAYPPLPVLCLSVCLTRLLSPHQSFSLWAGSGLVPQAEAAQPRAKLHLLRATHRNPRGQRPPHRRYAIPGNHATEGAFRQLRARRSWKLKNNNPKFSVGYFAAAEDVQLPDRRSRQREADGRSAEGTLIFLSLFLFL